MTTKTTNQSVFDPTQYSNESLQQALSSIDASRFPENYKLICDEIESRKASGRWQATQGRVAFENGGVDQLTLMIKPQAQPGVVIFLSIWLLAWAFFEIILFASLFGGVRIHSRTGQLFTTPELITFTLLWSVVGFFAINMMGWLVQGKEVILLEKQTLTFYKIIFKKKRGLRTFRTDEVQGIGGTIIQARGRKRRLAPVLFIRASSGSFIFGQGLGSQDAASVIDKFMSFGKAHGYHWITLDR